VKAGGKSESTGDEVREMCVYCCGVGPLTASGSERVFAGFQGSLLAPLRWLRAPTEPHATATAAIT
jgi:hypothetical protein